jgi:sugar phosphate isomerase/epimerase
MSTRTKGLEKTINFVYYTQFYYPRWGSENESWEAFCKKVKQAGYDGVETPILENSDNQALLSKTLHDNGLLLIAQYYQSFEKDFEVHKANYTID